MSKLIKADTILDNKRAGSLGVVMPRSQRGCRGFKSPSVHLYIRFGTPSKYRNFQFLDQSSSSSCKYFVCPDLKKIPHIYKIRRSCILYHIVYDIAFCVLFAFCHHKIKVQKFFAALINLIIAMINSHLSEETHDKKYAEFMDKISQNYFFDNDHYYPSI